MFEVNKLRRGELTPAGVSAHARNGWKHNGMQLEVVSATVLTGV